MPIQVQDRIQILIGAVECGLALSKSSPGSVQKLRRAQRCKKETSGIRPVRSRIVRSLCQPSLTLYDGKHIRAMHPESSHESFFVVAIAEFLSFLADTRPHSLHGVHEVAGGVGVCYSRKNVFVGSREFSLVQQLLLFSHWLIDTI